MDLLLMPVFNYIISSKHSAGKYAVLLAPDTRKEIVLSLFCEYLRHYLFFYPDHKSSLPFVGEVSSSHKAQ